MNINISDIKLVIWDLDDTFWKGTLSEGAIVPNNENIQLIKDLTDRGIVNTICSKNDHDATVKKLKDLGIDDYFVFKSIDWTPKGQRINQLIKDMGLRPVNCLFIDDNVVNLNEAQFYCKELKIAEPSEISSLKKYCNSTEISDLKHKRLNQYKVLENKQKAKAEAGDNLQFLYASNTKVEMHYDCKSIADRIFEMINRTNQLNFTKNRCSRAELDALLDDKEANCGYVTVKDNFGDYGIVGFFAIKNNKCIHFLFSCRTIGQGVEQWVYSTLGCPELVTVGEVVNKVKKISAPEWINQSLSSEKKISDRNQTKVIFKGACDLSILTSYLSSDNIIEEFTYVGNAGNVIEHHNHSVNILSFASIRAQQKEELLNDCVFNDRNMFETSMFNKDISIIFMSTQIEPMLGIYERKSDGIRIAFGDYIHPLTLKENWDGYINGKYACHQNKFTLQWLKYFSHNYKFIGQIEPSQYLENLKLILKIISPQTHICLLLGSETPFLKEQFDGYVDRHLYYKEINNLLREFALTNNKVHLIDFNDYIKDQSDFTNNINHFQRHIYYQAALKANEIITTITGKKVKQKGLLYLYLTSIRTRVAHSLNRDSFLFKILAFCNKIFHMRK